MARITRNKAAEILGVSRQTISNYIKEGILGSYVGEHGILYVNSEDIEKYAQKYKMIAANEKMIDEKLKEVEYRKRAINVELTELRDRATANGKLAANAVGMLFGVINTMSHLGVLPNLTYRESSLLKDIINGMTYDELSIKYGVSATRIRQIAEKTCNKLTYNEDIVIAELSTNRTLQYEVERLKKVIKSLQVSFDEYRRAKGDKPVSSAVLPPLILSRDINDCGFSVRILLFRRGFEAVYHAVKLILRHFALRRFFRRRFEAVYNAVKLVLRQRSFLHGRHLEAVNGLRRGDSIFLRRRNCGDSRFLPRKRHL